MGASASVDLGQDQVEELARETNFSTRDIVKLYRRFKRLDTSHNGTIGLDEFLSIPELVMNPLALRVVSLFVAPPPSLAAVTGRSTAVSPSASSDETFSNGSDLFGNGSSSESNNAVFGNGRINGERTNSDGSQKSSFPSEGHDSSGSDVSPMTASASFSRFSNASADGSVGEESYYGNDTGPAADEINFVQFVKTLSVFQPNASADDKLRFAFAIYDIKGDGFVTPQELLEVLKMMVGDNLSEDQLRTIVDKTMVEADTTGDGRISFEEFKECMTASDVHARLSIKF